MGKSRLSWELTHSPRTEGWLILEAGSVSYGKGTAYLPVVDLLRRYFQIDARDDARRIREKATGKLLALDRQLEPWLPALLALLDIALDDPQWERLDPPQRRQRILEGVKRLLLRESQVQPLLVLCEDLHWIDSESQAVLNSVVESLPTGRILLLVSYRPEYQHGWGRKTYYMQLRIDPLPQESAKELSRAILGDNPDLASLTQFLIKRTGGNPFFLEESVRALVETHALTGERGAYRLARPVDTIKVPATVQAVLAARIDRLPTEVKRLLQSAAVIGHEVPFAILHSIADLPEEPLRQGLAHLQAAEFLHEAKLFPDLEYAFRHALTHDVAYGSLLSKRRHELHARIVEAIERRHPDPVAHAERLAHHAFAGEEWQQAVRYLRQAGAKALARSAYRNSTAHLEQALVALRHLPQTPQTLEQAIDLRFELRNSLHPVGELQRALGYLRDADGLARSLNDQRRLGWLSVYMSGHLWQTGETAEALACAERAAHR